MVSVAKVEEGEDEQEKQYKPSTREHLVKKTRNAGCSSHIHLHPQQDENKHQGTNTNTLKDKLDQDTEEEAKNMMLNRMDILTTWQQEMYVDNGTPEGVRNVMITKRGYKDLANQMIKGRRSRKGDSKRKK